ncbi:MAG TPA: efflux RND transporter permease subunit, partial [Nannocystis exedens]|nr:efflux RND transporter permease subunit [Nannocystis exedens]
QITPTTQEQVSMVRVDGAEAVRLDIFRQAGANIVEVCDTVRTKVFGTERQQKWLAEGGRAPEKEEAPQEAKKKGKHGGDSMRAGRLAAERRNMTNFIAFRRPNGSKIVTLGDQSVFIRSALDEVRSAALLGGLLAIIILYLFLRSAYATLVVAVAIPLSIAVSFVPLMMFGVSLNIMSLGGLALGVGMLVDNSVVVLESIYRCREEGDGVRAAAIRGAEEVGGAVIASTLTTIAVFFPIVFVEGIAGQVFGDLALAVVCSLLASLLVALFVVPMMASRVYDLPQISRGERLTVALRGLPEWWAVRQRPWLRFAMPLLLPYAILRTIFELLGSALMLALVALLAPLVLLFKGIRALAGVTVRPIAVGTSAAVDRLRDGYAVMLRATLRAPFIVVLGTLLFGALAWWVGRGLGAELIPEVRQGVLIAELRFPVGTPLLETARRTAEFEQKLQRRPHVERVEAFLGEPEAGDDDAVERGPHTASITVRVEGDALAEADVVDSIRDLAHDLSGVDLEIDRPALFSLRPPIRVVILGHELDRLAQAATQIREVVAELPMVDDVRSSVRPGFPELQIRYDRMRLAALGMQPREVADRLRDQVQGTVPTALRDAGHRTDVRVRAQPESVGSRQDLKNLVINPGAPVPLPLEAVA